MCVPFEANETYGGEGGGESEDEHEDVVFGAEVEEDEPSSPSFCFLDEGMALSRESREVVEG